MTSRPDLLTNQSGNTLLAALQAAIPGAPASAAPGMADAAPALAEVSVATAFVTPAGFAAVAPQLDQAARVRLLLGAEPAPEAWRALRPAQSDPRRELADGLAKLDAGLRRERDRMPFTEESRRQLRAMARLLRSAKLETRRCTEAFLHAKATLLDRYEPSIFVGSSNLTRAGLTTNLELNLACHDAHVFAQARAWFDALWERAEPFDLAAIFEEWEAEVPPWLVFLRMLFALYGHDLAAETREVGEIGLTEFQKHGVWRARRILRDHGGVVIADEVGLGKTFIAGEILQATARNRQRALLVCPAALRDTTWKRFLDKHDISRRVEMVSYEELASDRQFLDAQRRPRSTRRVLNEALSEYALVVVDEAHNYRNASSPYRGEVLRRLMEGPRKDLVLLTATPVNNSLWDLYELFRYFLRQDGALARAGVTNIREKFREAARKDPADLSPDLLYPVIDAVTVRRTRAFVKRFHATDTLVGPDGQPRPIVFPKAVPKRVSYELEKSAPGLFDAVADALDPDTGKNLVRFARYAADAYLKKPDPDDPAASPEAAAGLLRSGLLKRFESSAEAFRLSLGRMVREHDLFLDALGKGKVVGTRFFRELADDDEGFEDLLETSGEARGAAEYDAGALAADVARDRAILADLAERLGAAPGDAKLDAVVEELARIAAEAERDGVLPEERARNRKVLVFSYFGDTVAWLRRALEERVNADPRLAAYRGRIVGVAGGGLEGEEASRNAAVWGFAPESSDPPPGQADLYDLLIATDVLAEGMNLQQCRHILNYDLPWNPMRLVQRHGRIDRIGSPHARVFLRTVFPADRLDALLTLEARILRKLAQAARSIGVATPPVERADAASHVFAETREAIEALAREDPALYERGGTAGAAQSGEEYRQRLRAALEADREGIAKLAGGVGSGMAKGKTSGVLFCAEVELPDEERPRVFLRFVPAMPGWSPAATVERELGLCLRLGDCTAETPAAMPEGIRDRVYAFWEAALDDILDEWERLSDPANLQPPIRPLNRQVAGFLRAHPPRAMDPAKLARALDVLESPWPLRDEQELRARFRDREGTNAERSARLAEWVLATGLERYEPPRPLPPIGREEVRLVCWLAVTAAA
jgi:hypothetical protein